MLAVGLPSSPSPGSLDQNSPAQRGLRWNTARLTCFPFSGRLSPFSPGWCGQETWAAKSTALFFL